jgi:hypothetical protein
MVESDDNEKGTIEQAFTELTITLAELEQRSRDAGELQDAEDAAEAIEHLQLAWECAARVVKGEDR